MVWSFTKSQTSWSVKSSRPQEALLQIKLAGVVEFQLSYLRSLKTVVKVLHSICQEIWKTQQWPQNWKMLVFIAISKKGNAKKNVQTTLQLHSFHMLVSFALKPSSQASAICENQELPDVQAGFQRGRGTRDQIANFHWIMEKAREFQKNIYFYFIP